MLFVLFHPTTFCTARHNGYLLVRECGLTGISFAQLSQKNNCARLIGMW